MAEPGLPDFQVLCVVHSWADHFHLSLIKEPRWTQTKVTQSTCWRNPVPPEYFLYFYIFYKISSVDLNIPIFLKFQLFSKLPLPFTAHQLLSSHIRVPHAWHMPIYRQYSHSAWVLSHLKLISILTKTPISCPGIIISIHIWEEGICHKISLDCQSVAFEHTICTEVKTC